MSLLSSVLWDDHKCDVASQCAPGSGDRDVSRFYACWNCGLQERVRDDGEIGRRSIEGNGGCPGEALAQKADGLSGFAGGEDEAGERRESGVKAVDGAATEVTSRVGASVAGDAVELSVGSLTQAVGIGTIRGLECMQRAERSRVREFENCAAASAGAGIAVEVTAAGGRAVEIAVAAFDQRLRRQAVRAIALRAETVKGGEAAVERKLEQRSVGE